MRSFFAARIVPVLGVGMIESFPEDVLRVRRKMVSDRERKIGIDAVGHNRALLLPQKPPLPPPSPSCTKIAQAALIFIITALIHPIAVRSLKLYSILRTRKIFVRAEGKQSSIARAKPIWLPFALMDSF